MSDAFAEHRLLAWAALEGTIATFGDGKRDVIKAAKVDAFNAAVVRDLP